MLWACKSGTVSPIGGVKGAHSTGKWSPLSQLIYLYYIAGISLTLPFQFSFSTFNFHHHRHHHQHLCNFIFLFCEQREKRFAKAKVIPPTFSSGKPIYLAIYLSIYDPFLFFLLYDMLIQSRLCNRVSQNCFCCFHESQHIKDDCNIFVSYIYFFEWKIQRSLFRIDND